MENNLHPDREPQRPRSMTMPPGQTQTGTNVKNITPGNADGEEIDEESTKVDKQHENSEELADVDFDETYDNDEVEDRVIEDEDDNNDSH